MAELPESVMDEYIDDMSKARANVKLRDVAPLASPVRTVY